MAPELTTYTVLMTGITSGMGLRAARILLENRNVRIVTGVRTPDRATTLANLPQDRLTFLSLDLESLSSVASFCNAVRDTIGSNGIHAIALNAGTQITNGLQTSMDGIEKTFAVNHLAHWLIAEKLGDVIVRDAPVIVTASGTHDPTDRIAKLFGFRGGVFPSAGAVAKGNLDQTAKPVQQCLDRYATSKMANIMHVLHKARIDPEHRWIAYDPGLMPGTGLARDRGYVERFAWNNVMPLLRFVMNGVSTAPQSGKRLADLLGGHQTTATGGYMEFSGRLLEPWEKARDEALQNDLHETSRRLAGSFL